MNQIYPKKYKDPNRHLDRRWIVDYSNLVYDGGGRGSWSKGYRTYTGARIASWWHYHIASWGGGSVTIRKNST